MVLWAKKIEKLIKSEKITEKTEPWKKKWLNWLEFFKKQPVWFGFGFIRLKLKKPNRTDQTQTEKKQSQPGKKTESNRNQSVWTGFFLK